MKTNMKRLFCLLLAALMIFAVAGCASSKDMKETASDPEWEDADDEVLDLDDGNTEKTDSEQGTESGQGQQNQNSQNGGSNSGKGNLDNLSWSQLVQQMPASLKGKTVTVFSWNPAKHVTGAEKVIADFTKQTGIKVNWVEGSYDNYNQEILAKINSGASPDIIRYQTCNLYRMELTQDAKTATGQDFSGSIWDQELIKAFTVKGKIYGVNLKNTFNQQPSAIFYSKKTIDRYKLDDPYELWKGGKWDFKAFSSICEKFKKATSRNAWMTNYHLDLLDFCNLDFITFDGTKFIDNSSDPKILTTMQKIASYRSNLTCEAMRTGELIENGTQLFATDNMLCARRTDFHYPTLKTEEDDLYCVPFPTIAGQTYYTRMHEYEAYGFPKGAKNGEAAYYFLRYYLNRANYDEKTFFCNQQALEVYDYLMKQKRSYKISGSLCENTVGKANCGLDGWLRLQADVNQVKPELDRQKPNFKRAVEAANAELKKFP